MHNNRLNGQMLVVDDDADVLTAARLLLKRHVNLVETESDPERIPRHLETAQWDIVLLDMNFALGANNGEEGLHWLEQIQQLQPEALVVLMTAYGGVETAVKAMKHGAVDFVLKPWQNERLLATLEAAIRLRNSRAEVRYLRSQQKEIQSDNGVTELLGQSPAIHELRTLIDRVAPTDANVLILGENGSGKEVVARELYRCSSRHDEVFVTVDLGAVTESLFESELFGHCKGAFTGASKERIGRFQAAAGGTLFLDEIGNLPLPQQVKLLTVLEQRQVVPVGTNTPVDIDVRLICATNQPLQAMVREGSFREDLLYRINTVELRIPPLRERPDDLPALLRHFCDQYAQKYGKPVPSIDAQALERLQAYDWPGNVRELRHAVERAIIMSSDRQLDAETLLMQRQPMTTAVRQDNGVESFNLEAQEKQTVEQALKAHQGNISKAARALGITRTSLYRRMEKYGL